ncbi:carboxylesterase family protein [Bacteroidales bacterium OttesenSCG-928-A17]|nr:carboxylesterase family protein [Bacteroidales bacterium OttesenSCG-928-A17]
MKKLVWVLLFLSFNLSVFSVSLKTIEKETFIYAVKGNDTLRLDKYSIKGYEKPQACVIFVFGGGFAGGSRSAENNTNYLKKLAESGYVSIGIDYRLGMKKGVLSDSLDIFTKLGNSVVMAVEDFFDATSFVYQNAEKWNINPEWIIGNGSSAGAITVLQGEYISCNEMPFSSQLPESFRYAGIIAFAGALFKDTEEFQWKNRPAPMQLFHGDADKNVPFNEIKMGPLGFHGSFSITEALKQIESPYYFHRVNNAAHEIANIPMKQNMNEIDDFIQKYVIEKKPFMIETTITEIGKPELEKNFSALDYIQTNYQ